MSHPALSPHRLTRVALELAPRRGPFVLLGLIPLLGALAVPQPELRLALSLIGASLLALAMLVSGLILGHDRACRKLCEALAEVSENDGVPVFYTDADGAIRFANAAARAHFALPRGATLGAVFADLLASPATRLYRLQNRAAATGAAAEELRLGDGPARLSARRVGEGTFLWRLDRAGPAEGGGDIALPMLSLSDGGTVLGLNAALRRLLGGPETALDRIVTDLPLRPDGLHHLAAARGPLPVRAIEMPRAGGGREIYFQPLETDRSAGSRDWGLIESLPVPLLKLDRSGRIVSANRRARALLADEAAVGRHLSDEVEGLGRPVSDWLRDAWAGQGLGRMETLRATHSDERFVQIALERLQEETGPALIAVLVDATAFKSLETQFVQSQKMQAVGQLAGGVAHDFNNLLTAISGHCDLLLLRHDPGDPDFADLNQIAQNANRAAALVGQLLAFSRKQTLRPELLDLSETLGDLSHLLGRLVGEQVTLDFACDPLVRPIRADRRQLEQVLMNLVVNARDAMLPGGGRIRLEVGNLSLSGPMARDNAELPPGEYVEIRVIDGGCGIPPEHLDKIFEPFFTTKGVGKGTGLGLSMCYGIVKQSGGYIFVDSTEGEGATFSLYFPAGRAEAEEAVATSEAARPVPVPEGGVVLLVEDEAPVRAFAARALQLQGYHVLEAESGEAALGLLEEGGAAVDVFVTDVVMPGMDGPRWVARALERRPGVKVIFISGYAGDPVAEHQARIPNSVFLPKPFSLAELTATVAGQLAGAASTSG